MTGETFLRRSKLSRRFLFLAIVLTVCFCVLSVRLFYLCINENDKYSKMADDNILSETPLKADRGNIYDRNMQMLATNETKWRIFLSPRDIDDEEEAEKIARGLCNALGEAVSYESVYKSATMWTARDRTVLRNATAEQKDAVLRFALAYGYTDALRTEATSTRVYPYGSVACHVLGFTGTDEGLSGLEAYYDEYLRGTDGVYLSSKDAAGGRLPDEADSFIPAVDGCDLVTTVDVTLQRLLENQLERTYADSEAANRVTGIVMDPNDGSLLAMATYPSYDLNSPFELDEYSLARLEDEYEKETDEYKKAKREALYAMWNNKAVSVLYEPGSTFKIITASIALEERVSSLSDRFFCSGSLKVQGYGMPIRCHKRTGHGSVSFAEALQKSCNPTMMTLAARIGGTRFMDYFISFGYASKTGIDLPGEALGIYHEREDFNTVELAVYSFGQTFKITPLRQLTSVCAVANGGMSVTPHMVSRIVNADGETVWQYTAEKEKRILSAETCRTVNAILEEGVSGDGGAKNAGVAGYKIAAKTGTSQKRDIKDENLYVGSCVAYAPSDDPQIAVIIVVDEPHSGIYYGSAVAAPYVSAFLEEALPYLGIEPNYTEAEQAARELEVGNYIGSGVKEARRALEELGLTVETVGEGEKVIAQIPSAGEKVVKKLGRVILLTTEGEGSKDTLSVPTVVGKTATDAIELLVGLGFNIEIDGVRDYGRGVGATVIAQSAINGELPRGSVIRLTLRYLDGED